MRSWTTSTKAATSCSVVRLPLEDGVDGEVGPLAHRHRVGGGDDAELGPGLGGEDLDLQPGPEPGLVGEEGGDLRQCVALYQGGPSSCRTLYEPEMVRTGPGSDTLPTAIGAIPAGRGGRSGVMNCTKHWSEHAVAACEECGQDWCAVCLVPPPKDGGPLRCIPCSLVIAGVRHADGGCAESRLRPATASAGVAARSPPARRRLSCDERASTPSVSVAC